MSEHMKRVSQSPKKPVSTPVESHPTQDNHFSAMKRQFVQSPELIMKLQSTHGNQFVQRFLRNTNHVPNIQRVTATKNITTKPNDKVPVAIHHVATEADARKLLKRLSKGDATALEEMEVTQTDAGKVGLQTHEWGLGFDKEENKFLIVQGGPGGVNWGHFTGNVMGIDHTHPEADTLTPEEVGDYQMRKAIFSENGLEDAVGSNLLAIISALVKAEQTIQGLPNKEFIAILPSTPDMQFQYKNRKTSIENIFTAYKLHHGNISKTKGHQIVTRYGPTTVTINGKYDDITKQNLQIDAENLQIDAENAGKPNNEKKRLKLKNSEQKTISRLCAPLEFMVNNKVIWSGWLYNDFTNSAGGILSQVAPSGPTYTRDQVRQTGVVMKD